MANKQPEVTEATRRAFMDAYSQLLTEDPNARISVRALTESTGYNRSTFYRYFQDVPQILEIMEDEVVADVAEGIAAELKESPDGSSMFAVFIGLDARRHGWLRALFSGDSSRFVDKLKGAVVPAYAGIAGVDASDERAACLLDMFFSAIFSQLSRYFSGKTTLGPEEVVALNRSLMEAWLMPQLREIGALEKGRSPSSL